MYCRNCGKEILNTDKFCANCGEANEFKSNVITEIKPNIDSQPNVVYVQQNNSLPMNWWKFWQYFRFPLGIILTASTIGEGLAMLEANMFTVMAVTIDVSMLILMIVTYYHFLVKNKIGYKFMTTWLIIESIYYALSLTIENLGDEYTTLMKFGCDFIITALIWAIIWTVPNYIYFQKRKHCFNDEYKDE